uniref:Antitoxin higA-2 n=1 Tax=mine drainage metagenome TaxID=410659 RepID=E6QTZ7_9ZZZZ
MKRDLFNEINEGFNALQSAREGKITLRQHIVEKKPAPSITPEELMALREKLHMSRTVFARCLRTNERTLENWEQGRASPNAQATILIRMVERYPDTVERLSAM